MVHRGGTLDAQLGEVCQGCEAGLEGGRLGQCIPLFEFSPLFWLQ